MYILKNSFIYCRKTKKICYLYLISPFANDSRSIEYKQENTEHKVFNILQVQCTIKNIVLI